MTSVDDHSSAPGAEPSWSPVVELRQYTLHPGKRDVLIELFDREFIESQEALGMKVIGQFRDVDDPDRFVWLRGFRNMATRALGLRAFYGGPAWQRHREVANATMIDSDNVLLLRPAQPGSGFSLGTHRRQPRGINQHGAGLVIATIYSLDARAEHEFIDYFSRKLKPRLLDSGAAVLAFFVTEGSPNNFPTLPVRENENVFAWFAGFADATTALRRGSDRASLQLSEADAPGLKRPPQRLRLTPTARSLLTGSSRACAAVSSPAETRDVGGDP
jgi:NIPSNAP